MQENLLNSVIKITKNRDVDSLEYSLISTIQEFIGCKEVSVYKDVEVQGQLTIEQSLCLKITGEKQFEWQQRQIVTHPEDELLSCLRSACIITVQSTDGIERRWLPITRQEKTVAAISVVSNSLDSPSQVMLNAFCRIFENYLVILHENERDKLTGLLNRQTFEKKIKQLIEKQVLKVHSLSRGEGKRLQKYASTSWLAILDIDHFKNINDKYGHICGDEVLLILAQNMRHFFRSTDLIFRFGGEEFVIVFEPTEADSISNKMAEFLQLVRNTSFPFIGNMTVSAGLARISPYDFPITVIENADKALYYAKNNGRDKFCIYEDLIAEQLIKVQENDSEIDLF
ncbi:GGDEF domain-containing protein [Pseudoalteromonas sp. Scap03]|uniref:GGDEF domain-containing protein n=1 Tax=unclassified Pseudoalteromonas TaxID=194690 RepID=UPI0015C0A287|nr:MULTISPECIES: GGDEF domain-containing protein [unclassified Pseudoalteromonas]NWL17367.1 GGDEF domain-containing protein [Pseudoalteromonas sp. Scap03]QLE83407.1 GGDEF domain-containing protein [Pseudoalteromonas sp. Scap25]QLE91349.1 GGDEF domain-containing protein [Pseudoalteromonas sp. Scap06]|tara:strand:+ start:1540 stop:2565 length:1026 start_codon:yes stop_codon:yes gene_type:complete